jgi:hypothetical protein
MLAAAMVMALLFGAVGAFASGGNVVTFTTIFHNTTGSFPTANPCSGATGTVTITFNGEFHVTLNTSTGTGHLTATETGNFVFVPDDPTQPTYTGHFTLWSGENINFQNFQASDTFHQRGIGSDGSVLQFQMNDDLTISASGVTNTFSNMRCG